MKGLVSLVLSGVLLVTFAAAASAARQPVPFECVSTAWAEATEGTFWESWGVSHARGVNPVWRNRGDPLCAGTLYLVFSHEINWITGEGTFWGDLADGPQAVPGRWLRRDLHGESLAHRRGLRGGLHGRERLRAFEGWRFRSTIVEIYLGYIVETGEAFAPGG